MKNLIFSAAILLFTITSSAQKATTTWSEEFKLKKGYNNFNVVHADVTGVYVEEERTYIKSAFVFGLGEKTTGTLLKLNKSFSQEYRIEYKKELKDKNYEEFFFLQNKAFILASKYDKKEQKINIFAAEINKKDGALIGEFKEITSINNVEKDYSLFIKYAYNADSSKMIMVSTDTKAAKSNFVVEVFDNELKKIGKTTTITNAYTPKTFQLEDVIYTTNDNIVMVGRVYDYQEGKKKKTKFLDFQNYNIQLYANNGKLMKEINTAVNNKWWVSSKVGQTNNNELIIAAFYSEEKKAKEINGLLVQRINATNGEIISTSQKEINSSMVSTEVKDLPDEDETKKERKERENMEKMKEEDEGFSRHYRFSNFIFSEDGNIIILAEKYQSTSFTYLSTVSTERGIRTTSNTVKTYESGDLMMSKINAEGQFVWVKVLPKNQKEVVTFGSAYVDQQSMNFSMGFSYFVKYRSPFFSGINSLPLSQNKLAIIFNDDVKNAKVTEPSQNAKLIKKYASSNCYVVYLDIATGEVTRKTLFSNNEQPISMPRLGIARNNDFYLFGEVSTGFSSKIIIGKISFK